MANICPVCDKKISIFNQEWVRIGFQKYLLHVDCAREFESQPEKYGGTPSNSEPSDKDFITTLLICVFLGGLGAHRFFVDKSDTGILMLVTLGGLGIWWIIDIILIVTGSFEDSEGRVIAYQAAGTANTITSTHVPEKVAEAPPAKDIPAQIEKLADLKDKGIITDEEFQQKKQELLDRI